MSPLKILYNVLGTVFVALGIAGIVLPLVPTTPFLLLAAACYFRGSRRLHDWLLNQRHLGPYLRNICDRRGLPLRAKVVTVVMLWGSIIASIIAMDILIVDILLVLVAAGVTAYLLRLPTLRIVRPAPSTAVPAEVAPAFEPE